MEWSGQCHMYKYTYSNPSDSGPSEIGTLYNKPLYKRHCLRSQKLHTLLIIVLVHLEPLKEDNLSIKDKTAEFILSPTCPLFGGSTVCTMSCMLLTKGFWMTGPGLKVYMYLEFYILT